MGKSKKVILLLVEGPSDESALVGPLKALWGISDEHPSVRVEPEPFYCDVTTVHLFKNNESVRKRVDFKITDQVLKNVNGLIKERIDQRHTYDWKDLVQIVHFVDLDGAFIPNTCILQGSESGFHYSDDHIEASDVAAAVRRNEAKAASLRKLIPNSVIKHGAYRIPYDVYFLSRNLEHALYGHPQDFSDEEKEELSSKFGEWYQAHPNDFAQLLLSDDVRVPGEDLADTWKYVQQGTNSLKRGSNLHLLINGFDATGPA